MKPKKKIVLSMLVLVGILVLSFSPIVQAHEIGDGKWYRWWDIRFTVTTDTYVYVSCNSDNLKSPLSSYYGSSLTHWTNNSANKAQFVNTSFSIVTM